MAKENVDISKNGIKAPLLTFISNHSTSLIIVGFFVFAYHFPVFDHKLSNNLNINLSNTEKVFIYFLIIMLLHPLGLFVNMLSWIVLGRIEKIIETLHFKRKCLSRGTKNYFCFEELKTELKLTEENFYETSRQKEHYLTVNNVEILNEYDSFLGGSILLRNLTLCSIIIAAVFFKLNCCCAGFLTILFALLFTTMNSYISFYYSLSILRLYKENIEKEKKDDAKTN